MKKRRWTLLILTIALLAAGCAGSAEDEAVMVEELPIEQTESGGAVAVEDTEPDVDPAAVAVEKEALEEIEVEVNGDKGIITIGTTGAPYTEILTQAKILMAKEGWDLQIEKYDDYQKLNGDVLNGTLDAHLFAHQTYVDSYNDVNDTSLQTVDIICYEVYGVYSEINQDLTKVSGAKIGIPADVTKKGRALMFMQDLGWITLKEKVGITAIVEDITENAKNLQFVEYDSDSDSLTSVMEGVDYCIIGADIAIAAGLDIEEVLQEETSRHKSAEMFAAVLVAAEEYAQSEKLDALADALSSKEMREYFEETYRGAYMILE